MKKHIVVIGLLLAVCMWFGTGAFAAYHHEGENDAANFLSAYPTKAETKLDNCNLCHRGGSYVKYDKTVQLGSCQWCHRTYGYDGSGNIAETMNAYGLAYNVAGRNAQAVTAINAADSDGDGHTNAQEIGANTYPGDDGDYPGLAPAPFRVYTLAQLEALGAHTQFMLMNTSRSGDFYAEYTGVPMKALLDDVGIKAEATSITVYAPDGWGQSHPLAYDADLDSYHVYGNKPGETFQYPPATYYYDTQADVAETPTCGWCDYSAPSCTGWVHGTPIAVSGGLKAILAYKREGAYLDTGVLNAENKLDGEGPFRVVVPQKYPEAPDQSSKADGDCTEVIWPYDYEWDHNAGSCSRSATIIRVEPLPPGMTDIDLLEVGWNFVDQKKIIVYGAIDNTDSNDNGILDSEEGADENKDYDGDGTPDYRDRDTASFRHPNGADNVLMHTSGGSLAEVACLADDDIDVPQGSKPSREFPYGLNRFHIIGLTAGDSVIVKVKYPGPIPTNAEYYKVTAAGVWKKVEFGSNDGDDTITLVLTDGDPGTDADGTADGTIVDPGGITTPATSSSSGDSDNCFINSMF